MVTCEHCGEPHDERAKFCPATGRPLPARPAPPVAERGLWDLLAEAARIYRANLRAFLLAAAALFVPGCLLTTGALWLLSFPAQGVLATALSLVGWAITALVLYGFVLPQVQGALAMLLADRQRGGRADWHDVLWRLLRRMPVLNAALAPTALLLAVGFLLGVVPGMVVGFFAMFVAPVALVEGLTGLAAFRRSAALVRADWLRTALLLVAFGVTWSLAHWLAGLLGVFFVSLVGDLLFLLVLPVPMIASVLLYLDLRRKVDGLGDAAIDGALEALKPARLRT